jgi:ech hydrogenase subunit D
VLPNEVIIGADRLLGETAGLKRDGYRFITMTGLRSNAAGTEILYHFDRELQYRHLRLTVAEDAQIPSITPIYFGAFLAENEIRDLFGITFEGLVLDYGGTLLRAASSGPAPFCRIGINHETASDPPWGGDD